MVSEGLLLLKVIIVGANELKKIELYHPPLRFKIKPLSELRDPSMVKCSKFIIIYGV